MCNSLYHLLSGLCLAVYIPLQIYQMCDVLCFSAWKFSANLFGLITFLLSMFIVSIGNNYCTFSYLLSQLFCASINVLPDTVKRDALGIDS